MADEQDIYPSGPLRLESCILTDAGRRRTTNDDYATAYVPDDPRVRLDEGCLYLVADGLGGQASGEESSRYAAERVLADYYELRDSPPGERLRQVLRAVGNELYAMSRSGGPAGGITTLVAAVVLQDSLTIANVGDSRAYLIHDGQAQQITRDHNQASELLRMDALSVGEVESAGGQNRLTRSLGGQRDVEVDVFADIPLYPGDVLLLCSDGLTRYADDEQIARLAGSGIPGQACQELVDWANRGGGEDNITALVVAVKGEAPLLGGLASPVESSFEAGFLPIPGAQAAGVPSKPRPALTTRRVIVAGALAGVLLLAALIWQLAGRMRQEAIEPTGLPMETSVPAAVAAAPTQESSTPMPTVSRAAAASPTATGQASPSPLPVTTGNTCVWPVEAGQSLFSIVRRFELPYSASDGYFYYETCDLEREVCTGERAEIESHASIFTGWHVVIPVEGAEACVRGEGSWVQAGE
jgi:protein phosphatase